MEKDRDDDTHSVGEIPKSAADISTSFQILKDGYGLELKRGRRRDLVTGSEDLC